MTEDTTDEKTDAIETLTRALGAALAEQDRLASEVRRLNAAHSAPAPAKRIEARASEDYRRAERYRANGMGDATLVGELMESLFRIIDMAKRGQQ